MDIRFLYALYIVAGILLALLVRDGLHRSRKHAKETVAELVQRIASSIVILLNGKFGYIIHKEIKRKIDEIKDGDQLTEFFQELVDPLIEQEEGFVEPTGDDPALIDLGSREGIAEANELIRNKEEDVPGGAQFWL